MKNEKETKDSPIRKEEKIEVGKFLDENRKQIMWVLAILFAIFVVVWANELNKEMDWLDECEKLNLTYKYSLTCVGVDEEGEEIWYGKIRNINGNEVMHYYGKKLEEGDYEFPLR